MVNEIVLNSQTLGNYARRYRKQKNISLKAATTNADIGIRFLSEFERGKPTAELGKVLEALDSIGLQLVVQPKPAKPKVGFAFKGHKFRLVKRNAD